jgi:hypothetical protein
MINKDGNIFGVWLDATLNFQRLDFTGLPLDITVTYVTPLFKRHQSDEGQSQYHRLRDAAYETHMSFLEEWFPTRCENLEKGATLTNRAITYRRLHRDNAEKEELTLDLRALSGKALMTKGMDSFWQCLQQWKRFNEDRDFPGDYVSVVPE